MRKKARENKELNYTEQRLLELTGTVAVTGLLCEEVGATEQEEVCHSMEVKLCEAGEDEVQEETNEEDEIDKENVTPVENIIIEVETPAKQKQKRKKMENPLLSAYKEGQESERQGLSDIATALEKIAKGIDRFCDLYEKKNNVNL